MPTAYSLPAAEREHLRKLARRQAEIAALPVQQERRAKWTAMNDTRPGAAATRPPVVVESWTFDRDFLPAALYQCQSGYGRHLETQFLRAIRHHELLGDDHVCPDTIDLGWHIHGDEFGIPIKTELVRDAEGVETGYHFEPVITDLSEGLDMLKPSTHSVDRDGTAAEKQFLEETFGDILPVALRWNGGPANNLTQRIMRLMSMETLYLGMYDAPENVHALMRLMQGNARDRALWAEKEGLVLPNNGNQTTCGSCYNFTTLLPGGEELAAQGSPAARLSQTWGVMDSQESIGLSPELFNEFIYPYYKELAGLYGLLYWGCCEPADAFWESSLHTLPNLKAVSISRWADQPKMADMLANQGIIYSRKPNPNLLGVDVALNEEAWAREIRNTLELTAGKNIPVEFVVRDVYTVHGNLEKPRRAVEIAQREIDRFFPGG